MHLDEEMVDHVELHFSFLNSQLQESAYRSISTTAKFCGFKHRTRNRFLRNWREAFGATFSKSSDNRVQTCCILAKPSAQRMLLMVFPVENGRQLGQAEVEEL